MTPLVVAAVLAATVAGGAVQATLGFGGAFIAVPVLAVLLPGTVPVAMLVGLFPVTAAVAWRERASLDRPAFRRMAIARLPGIALGTAVVALAPVDALTVLIAASLLLAVVAGAAGWEIERTPRNERLIAAVSGFTGTSVALGGPPVALLYRRAGAADRRATLNAIFSVGIVIALILLALSGEVGPEQLRVGALVFVGQAIGAVAAEPLVRRAGDELLRRAVLAWAGVGAAASLLRALL